MSRRSSGHTPNFCARRSLGALCLLGARTLPLGSAGRRAGIGRAKRLIASRTRRWLSDESDAGAYNRYGFFVKEEGFSRRCEGAKKSRRGIAAPQASFLHLCEFRRPGNLQRLRRTANSFATSCLSPFAPSREIFDQRKTSRYHTRPTRKMGPTLLPTPLSPAPYVANWRLHRTCLTFHLAAVMLIERRECLGHRGALAS